MSLKSLHSGGSPFGRFFRSLRTTRQFSTASRQPCGSPFLYWSVIRFATTDFLVVVRFIFGSLASCAQECFLCGGAFFCSWVLRSLVRIGERGERERGRGVSAFLAGWLVLLFLGSGVGFAPPRWLAPAVFPVPARWVALLAAVFPKLAYVGFSCSALARLLAARLPLAFPRGLFLSLCYLL